MKNEMTISQKFDALANYFIETEEVVDLGFNIVDFLNDRKAKSVKKSTKKANPENATIYSEIITVLSDKKSRTNAQITKAVNSALGTDYNTQKIQAQVTILKNEGKVIRTEGEKKAVLFTINPAILDNKGADDNEGVDTDNEGADE